MRAASSLTLAVLCATSLCLWPARGSAQTDDVTVLVVVAHPDDDAMFAATVYKLTHALGGKVDLALITDGSGGFGYAHFAKPMYGLDLTDEQVARKRLPAIRKRELMAGGALIGVRDYFFLDERDDAYTENVDSVLTDVWDAERVRSWLVGLMERETYDYVFVHLPIVAFHAHHKSSAILALRAATSVAPERRPVVLGSFWAESEDDPAQRDFREHPGYPITRIDPDVGPFFFDRRQKVDATGRLDYSIIVNWLIAEHKSQGTMQLLMNRGKVERFFWFAVNDPAKVAATTTLFERLGEPWVPGTEAP